MAEGLSRQDTSVVDKKFGREIIGSIQNEVIVPDQLQDVFSGHKGVIGIHGHIRVQPVHGLPGGVYLGLSQILCGMDDLPLQIGQIHHIGIGNSDGPYTRGGQIHGRRGTQAAGSDDQDLCIQKFFLSLHAYFVQDQMAGIALNLFISQCHYAPPPIK